MSTTKQSTPGKVRIIGGRWRGTVLTLSKQSELRPSLSRVRTTLFNWLHSYLPGSSCADLCCGSGVLGLEALSRGAATLTSVERHRPTVAKLQEKITELEASEYATVVCQDLSKWLRDTQQSFDVVFLDPPFDDPHRDDYLASIERGNIVKSGGFIYLESALDGDERIPDSWQIHKQCDYSNLRSTLYKVV